MIKPSTQQRVLINMTISPQNKLKYQWIDSDKQLFSEIVTFSNTAYVAVDTEFIRNKQFYPQPGLIQIASDTAILLIDPRAITCWNCLSQLFQNKSIVKVMHDAKEDLEVFRCLSITAPTPLFDTQIAWAMLSTTAQISYQQLIRELLTLQPCKAETRSNWLQRPLSEQQIEYAIMDAYYLYQIYPLLKNKLSELQRLSWVKEECQQVISHHNQPFDFSTLWQQVHLAWKLNTTEKKILRALCIFREQKARTNNIIKKKILPSKCLWPLARYKPLSNNQLKRIKNLPDSMIKRYGADIITIIKSPEFLCSDTLGKIDPPLPKSVKPYFDTITTCCHTIAKNHNIATKLLNGKALAKEILTHFLKTGEFVAPKNLMGWRKTLLDHEIMATLETLQTSLCKNNGHPIKNDEQGE